MTFTRGTRRKEDRLELRLEPANRRLLDEAAAALLAATAIVHDLVLVTRNVCDVERTGVRLWDPTASH